MKLLILLSLVIANYAMASSSTYYCDDTYLKDIKTGKMIRIIPNYPAETSCASVLAKSKDGFFCDDTYLNDLKTGKMIRIIPNSPTLTSCDYTLRKSRNGMFCEDTYLNDLRTGELIRIIPRTSDSSCKETLGSSNH